MKVERQKLAMLTIMSHEFAPPYDIEELLRLRDRILRDECGLSPDGKRMEGARVKEKEGVR